jgi:hypothetical protein
MAEALFAGLLATGFRNLHGVIHHQTENFAQGMPTDLTFRLAGAQRDLPASGGARGPGWWGKGEMADYYDRPRGGLRTRSTGSAFTPCFPKGADFPFDHAGGRDRPDAGAGPRDGGDGPALEKGGHWYTETARQATRELGEKGGAIALAHMRSVLGLATDCRTYNSGRVHHALLQDEAAIGAGIGGADDREGPLGGLVEGEALQRLHRAPAALGFVGHGLHPGKDRHLEGGGVAHHFHPGDRGGTKVSSGISDRIARAAVGMSQPAMSTSRAIGGGRGDGRRGVVHVADHQIVAMAHEHEDMDDLG